jgi:hypothetical protein
MATKFVDWSDKVGKGDSDAGGQFLKLKAGSKYRVRLCGKAVCYMQHWEPIPCRSPGKETDPLIAEGKTPKARYAIWVIDRNDENRLKVMDFPPTLFEQFGAWKMATGEEPGGKKGTDWQISLDIPPGQDKRKTKYSAMPLDRTVFTDEEIKAMQEIGIQKKLAELRRDHTPQEIMQMLADKGLGVASGSKPVQASVQQEAPAQKPAAKFDPDKEDPLAF